MNPRTNEVIRLETDESTATEADLCAAVKKALAGAGKDFEALPPELEHAAESVLRDKRKITVARHSGGALSKHAARRRRERRR